MDNKTMTMAASQRLLKKSNKSALQKEKRGKYLVLASALLIISATIAITIFLGSKGLQAFISNGVSIYEFLTSTKWNPTAENPLYGAVPFILGSFAVTFLSALIAAPLGIGGAIFMTEIAPSWGKRFFSRLSSCLLVFHLLFMDSSAFLFLFRSFGILLADKDSACSLG